MNSTVVPRYVNTRMARFASTVGLLVPNEKLPTPGQFVSKGPPDTGPSTAASGGSYEAESLLCSGCAADIGRNSA